MNRFTRIIRHHRINTQQFAGGASESRAWLESRLGQIFDAVYTAPGQKVAIHIEAQINLDQRSDARKLAYGNHGAKARTLD